MQNDLNKTGEINLKGSAGRQSITDNNSIIADTTVYPGISATSNQSVVTVGQGKIQALAAGNSSGKPSAIAKITDDNKNAAHAKSLEQKLRSLGKPTG